MIKHRLKRGILLQTQLEHSQYQDSMLKADFSQKKIILLSTSQRLKAWADFQSLREARHSTASLNSLFSIFQGSFKGRFLQEKNVFFEIVLQSNEGELRLSTESANKILLLLFGVRLGLLRKCRNYFDL